MKVSAMNTSRALAALAVVSTLGLSGCETVQPQIIETHYVAVTPPVAMYKCYVPKKPDTNTLTDIDTGKFIIDLYGDLLGCRNSLRAVKTFETKAATVFPPVAVPPK